MAAIMRAYTAFANFEATFDAQTCTIFTREHAEIPIFAVAAYLLVVFQLPLLMGNTKMNLRGMVACWNGLLAVFSAIGFSRVAPVLYSQVRSGDDSYSSVSRLFCFCTHMYILLLVHSHFRLSPICVCPCICVYPCACVCVCI